VLVAVQEEVLDEIGQQLEPAGFQLISLPFSDDIRDPVKVGYCPFADIILKSPIGQACSSKELAAS
jgi:hypothetical protein